MLDTKTGKLYEFPCNRWFPDENDGSLSCDIELPKPKDGEGWENFSSLLLSQTSLLVDYFNKSICMNSLHISLGCFSLFSLHSASEQS